MDRFTRAYIECALWSSTDYDGDPLDVYDWKDIDPVTFAQFEADCAAFQATHGEDIAADVERAGPDFWLTRNHHGAGFWDGDWPVEVGKRLTDASHAFGEVDLYVGDDGKIHS